MATGTSIYNIITSNRLPDGVDTFTAGGVSLGSVEIKNFYGNITVGATDDNANGFYTVAQIFSDVTAPQDSIMCVRIFHGNLTIANGTTFTPTHRTKGLFVFVKGNLTNNGTITMTGKGSSASGANVYLWGSAIVPSAGQLGGDTVRTFTTADNSIAGKSPEQSSKSLPARGTGGGGSGSARKLGSGSNWAETLAGSQGTSWSGGFGSGGVTGAATNTTGLAATSTTGGEARIVTTATGPFYVGGGSGVIGGTAKLRSSSTTTDETNFPYKPTDGTAGLLMIACLGTYTNNGTVSSIGTVGGTGSTNHGNGGSSGGGSINITAKTIATEGTRTVAGGAGAITGTPSSLNTAGGAGGAGSYTANTLTTDGVTTLPRRTLFYSGTTLYFYDFGASTWKPATGSGSAPYETYGMFDAELSALTLAEIDDLPGYTANAVKIRTYTPS